MDALADINIKKDPQEIVCGNFVIAIVISSAATMNSQHIIGNSKYLPSLYYKTRKIGNIKSHDIDIAVIIFPLMVQPTMYCSPRGLFSRKPVRLEITAILLRSLF